MTPDTTPLRGPLSEPVRVWDPFVRVFHWSLVSCVLLNQFVLDDGKLAHRWAGYTATALVLARLLWAVVGTRHARFADWFPTPTRLRAHVGALMRGETPHYLGHSPLGALMMLALMTLVLALGATGWLQTTDAFWGEEWLEEVHEVLANTLMLAAGLHALAAIALSRLERVRLIRAMFTGVKRPY